MGGFLIDVRHAIRQVARTPGFFALAAGVLALGLGATLTIFSLLDAALLRPLPFPEPERLVMLWERAPQYAHNRVSPLNFLDWSEQQHSFAAIAAIAGGSRTLTTRDGTAERIPGQAVTVRFFDVLGITPVAGRTFSPDDVSKRALVVVLSERIWKSRFGADPSIVGRTVTLDGDPYTIVGIVPASFQLLYPADMWTLFVPRRSPEQRRQHYMQVIARLAPSVTTNRAAADMANIAAHIADISPETNRGWGVTIEPLRNGIVGVDLKTTTIVLAAAVAFVLLMACANVASLLLARGLGRSRELAIRAAIGSTRGRLARQLLVESLVLAVIGGTAGTALGWASLAAAPSLIPRETLPAGIALAFDSRLVLAAASLTLITTVLCGVVPAWQSSKTSLAEATGAGGRGATARAGTWRAALVVVEVAAAVLLVAGAGLFLRTLLAIDRTEPGYRADRVLTGSVVLPFGRYDSVDRMLQFYQGAQRELEAIPGVKVAAFGGSLPLDGWDIGQGFSIVGDPPREVGNGLAAHYLIVSATYFRALGIDILRGREFTDRDVVSAPQVCIVNEEFVRRHIGSRNPIGMRVSVMSMDLKGGPTPVVREIVGVARQVVETPGEKERGVGIYVPITQNPWFSSIAIVQTAGDPPAAQNAMKAAIAKIDRDQPLTRIRTMDEVAAQATAQPRFRARLVSAFAITAVLLASVGIFGVLAYSVNQRAREFGIRTALGATSIDVLMLVLGSTMKMTFAGIAIGLAAAAALTRFLATLLFGVTPLDPTTFTVTAAILAAAALTACVAPALWAVRIDPASTLKSEF